MPVLCVCVVWGQLVCCSFELRLLRLPQGVGVSRSTLSASLLEHPSMSQAFHPPTQRDHTTLWSPRSHAQCSTIAAACVSSPKDWAVLIGSHMQQKRWSFLLAPPTSRRTCPHMDCTNRNAKHKVQQLHVGKPCSRRETQRNIRAHLGDLSAPICTTGS